jgi:hypothetical protein
MAMVHSGADDGTGGVGQGQQLGDGGMCAIQQHAFLKLQLSIRECV